MINNPSNQGSESGWKILSLNQSGSIKLHLKSAAIEDDKSFSLPADVTPRTSFLMKIYGQAQPLVRAWQYWLDGRASKAKQILGDGKTCDEQILLAMILWQEGDLAGAEKIFRTSLANRKQAGMTFRKYGIPLALEIKPAMHVNDDHRSEVSESLETMFHAPGFSLFAFIYASICFGLGKPFLAFEMLKGHILLNPDDHEFLIASFQVIDELENRKEVLPFFVAITENIQPVSPVTTKILLERARCQFQLNRNYPALFTLKKIQPEKLTCSTDHEIVLLQAEINEKLGKVRDSSRQMRKLQLKDLDHSSMDEISGAELTS